MAFTTKSPPALRASRSQARHANTAQLSFDTSCEGDNHCLQHCTVYRDEELELGEVVNFQIPVELNAGRRWLEAGQALVLQMELMFSKLDSLETDGSKKKATNGAGSASVPNGSSNGEKGEGEEEALLNLHPVSVQRFHTSLGGGHWGIHAYVPVTFSGVHFVRVDCMVHGVLRNLKLEPPRADLRGLAQPTTLTTMARDDVNESAPLARLEHPTDHDDDVDVEAGLPVELGRLKAQDLSLSNGKTMIVKRRKAYPPKYTWFSLYDDQGVGRRRTTKRRADSGGLPGTLPLLDSGDVSVASGVASEDSSGKGDKTPWRWGWRRKRGSNGGRGFPGQEGIGGGDRETSEYDGSQVVELLTIKSLQGPGKRLEDLERKDNIRRRKDVYSYFVMPLVRALEAQTGTTTWLRKLMEAKNTRVKPASAAPLWIPPDPSCWDDITRVLWRLFAPDERDKAVKLAPSKESRTAARDGRGPSSKNAATADGVAPEKGLPPMARVAFPGLIARYCRDTPEADESGGSRWLDDDDETCKALETDVHAFAMLVFVEWREFVSALPGCGELLSTETSALWLAQLRQRWACQATLHTCLALQKPPDIVTASKPTADSYSPAFDHLGLPSKLPASAQGAPLYSRLEPELGSESFGTAVRMACADASAPYKLPLQDQHMFPDGDTTLPVCLVQRYEASNEEGGKVTKVVRTQNNGESECSGNRLGPFIVTKTPPLSPVWMPNVTPAFRPPSSKIQKGRVSQLPAPSDASCVLIRSPPRPPRLATAPASPVSRFDNVCRLRAASSSPKANRSRVPTIDASTAAAAVAAAVAAISAEEGSDDSPPSSPPAERHVRGWEKHRHIRLRSTSSELEAAKRLLGKQMVLSEVSVGRQKPFRSLSPPQPVETSKMLLMHRRCWSEFTLPGGVEHKLEGARVGEATAGKDYRNTNGGKDEQGPSFNIWGRDPSFPSRTVRTGRPPNRDPYPPPATPHRPPRSKAPTTQARRSVSPPLVVPLLVPSTPAREPMPRKSPSASPARPPPKPMAEDRGRELRHDDSKGHSGEGEDDGGDSAELRSRRDYVRPGSSLLDGVEQSSDLGAFFRQHDDHYDEHGHSNSNSSTRRRRRGRTSPRSFSNDVDVEDDEEGGGENGRSAGVGLHVIVLHHGYCGSSMDMRLIKNYIRILAPDALVLNAESNERDQHTSMKVMGEKLAKEVHRFLLVRARSLMLPGGQGRLSFMGHSAGAIIIRVALTHKILEPALKHMHLFVSLGTPHLGTIYGASGIVRTGMWAMKRWMKSRLLEEIGLTDAPQPRETLLYWLSKQPGLEHFRHIVLISADKDGYVPCQSARIQMCDSSVRDAIREVPHGQVVCEMARAILSPIKESSLYRLHLWGGVKQSSGGGGAVDEYIGRAAHISMMDSPSLVCLLLCTLLDLIR